MGQGSSFCNGKGLNTIGSKLINQKRIDKILEKNPILREIVKSGVKINVEDVIFAVRDKSNQLVWLEKGNDTTGLKHIIDKHGKQFCAKYNISQKRLSSQLKKIVSEGIVVKTSKVLLANGKEGIERIYAYKNKYLVLGAIGSNGYIVSMYPIKGGK